MGSHLKNKYVLDNNLQNSKLPDAETLSLDLVPLEDQKSSNEVQVTEYNYHIFKLISRMPVIFFKLYYTYCIHRGVQHLLDIFFLKNSIKNSSGRVDWIGYPIKNYDSTMCCLVCYCK